MPTRLSIVTSHTELCCSLVRFSSKPPLIFHRISHPHLGSNVTSNRALTHSSKGTHIERFPGHLQPPLDLDLLQSTLTRTSGLSQFPSDLQAGEVGAEVQALEGLLLAQGRQRDHRVDDRGLVGPRRHLKSKTSGKTSGKTSQVRQVSATREATNVGQKRESKRGQTRTASSRAASSSSGVTQK